MTGNGYHDDRPVERMPRRWPFEVRLEREPENPHDRNAVAVVVDGKRAGYIARYQARKYAPLLDFLEARFSAVTATAKVIRRQGAHDLYVDLLSPEQLQKWASIPE